MRRVVCFLIALGLLGCGGGEYSPSRPTRVQAVRMDWLGYESFVFRSSLGLRIVTNPYHRSATGRIFPKGLHPEIVLISNESPVANNIDAFDNTPTVFRGAVGLGPNSANGIRIQGVSTSDSPENGSPPANLNLAFSWRMDGIRFCFLGNVRRPLTAPEVLQIGPVDVLLIPVGVPLGLTDAERRTLITQLHPRVVIPMGPSGSFSRWLAGFTRVYRLPGSSVLLSPRTLPAEPTVLVFQR